MTLEELRSEAEIKIRELTKCGKPVIYFGAASCGRAAGVLETISAAREALDEVNAEAELVEVGCIGMCCYEPLVYLSVTGSQPLCFGNVTPSRMKKIISSFIVNNNSLDDMDNKTYPLGVLDLDGYENVVGIPPLTQHPMLKPQVRLVLRNCGKIDPTDIKDYVSNDGYRALEKILKMEPEEVIDEIKRSGLGGRGGAGFPTGLKWELCRNNQSDFRYLICNADEGDPGAFMNRSLLESDPHAVLEGMLIAGYAIGCREGYIYIRAEYPLAIKRLNTAIEQMKKHNLLGQNILDNGFSFDINIKKGAGAFVCGEETALMASIEGKRGMPRPRPPFPAQSGLWGEPTNINNVGTLGSVANIIRMGGVEFARFGSETAKGTKTFSLVGKIERTGLIEVPLGTSLGEIIFDIGGGIKGGKKFKAVQTGGPSGGCIPASKIDISVDYKSLSEVGSIMGSGGIVVMDEDTCMVDIAKFFLTFTQDESCGKCPPCRIGTKRMLEILIRITEGRGRPEDIDQLIKLCDTIGKASLCGLGQTAPNPVLTTLTYFRDEYEAHIYTKRCPAKVCKELYEFHIDPETCIGCGQCSKACPVNAITGERKEVHIIDKDECIKCGVCFAVCPKKVRAVKKIDRYPKTDEEGDLE